MGEPLMGGTDVPTRSRVPVIAVLLILAVLLTGCATPDSGSGGSTAAGSSEIAESPEAGLPDWVRTPPCEEGYIYGIGRDSDVAIARQKAIINIGQQLRTQVSSVFEEETTVSDTSKVFVSYISEQLTDVDVVGARICDEFDAKDGGRWALARAPLDCILDAAESVILSYRLELEQDAPVMDRIVEELEISTRRSASAYYVEPAADTAAAGTVLTDASGHAVTPLRPAMITVDGRSEDWEGIEPIVIDPAGDSSDGRADTDIRAVYLAHDGESLYLRIDLGDKPPSSRELYLGVAVEDAGGQMDRFLFTSYRDGSWETAVDEWTVKSAGRHTRISEGTVRSRNNVIEARFDMDKLEMIPDTVLRCKAWDDANGVNFDGTAPSLFIWEPERNYFVYRGTVLDDTVNRITWSPQTLTDPGSVLVIRDTYTDPIHGNIWNDIRFVTDELKVGKRNSIRKDTTPDAPVAIHSELIMRELGFGGWGAMGTITVREFDGERIAGSFALESWESGRMEIEGLFSVAIP